MIGTGRPPARLRLAQELGPVLARQFGLAWKFGLVAPQPRPSGGR
jgi:hypothetical protein